MSIDYKNVLHVSPDIKYWNGGIISVVSQYQENIPDFQYHPSTGPKHKLLNVLVYPYVIFHFIYTLLFNKAIKIVHLHVAVHGSFYRKYILFLISKYLFGKKIIYHTHGAEVHLFYENAATPIKRLIRHFINKADNVIVLSASWKKYFADTFHDANLTVVPNIVASVSPRRSEENEHNYPLVFLFLGAIGKRKGIYDLLEAIAAHKEELEGKCIFKIGGDGEVEKLLAKIQEMHLQNLVQYLGFVSGERKQNLLSTSHVYILPSHNEGLPISILEAMAYSMPVISTTVGGIPEIVKNGENGVLVTPADLEGLYKAIARFVAKPQLINSYGCKSYEIVSQKYFPDHVVHVLQNVYQQVLRI